MSRELMSWAANVWRKLMGGKIMSFGKCIYPGRTLSTINRKCPKVDPKMRYVHLQNFRMQTIQNISHFYIVRYLTEQTEHR